MPGAVDTHVHVAEGFETTTRAAAAGGVTTIVVMPDQAGPPARTAGGACFVDVGFWGGIDPGNVAGLDALAADGVLGFTCDVAADIRPALPVVAKLGLPLLVHAVLPGPIERAAAAARAAAEIAASERAAAERAATERRMAEQAAAEKVAAELQAERERRAAAARAAAAQQPVPPPLRALEGRESPPARVEADGAPTTDLQLVLSPVRSFARLVEVERRIQSLPTVRSLYVRDFRGGIATLTVALRSPMTTEEFASGLRVIDEPQLRLVSGTRNVLEFRIEGEASIA